MQLNTIHEAGIRRNEHIYTCTFMHIYIPHTPYMSQGFTQRPHAQDCPRTREIPTVSLIQAEGKNESDADIWQKHSANSEFERCKSIVKDCAVEAAMSHYQQYRCNQGCAPVFSSPPLSSSFLSPSPLIAKFYGGHQIP